MAALRKLDDLMKAETDPVKAFDLSRLRLVLSIVHRDWDSSAAARAGEITALLSLLRNGAEISPPPLRRMLEDAVEKASRDADLRISTLEATIDHLLMALIELQIWLEVTPSEAARTLLDEVWSQLERRARQGAVMDSIW
ncbi:MAG: hypothetical protein HY017_33360 [Betaproteobacteria bacterium]|nr:hypothetical protein [Betaproteobacteria bacterium]